MKKLVLLFSSLFLLLLLIFLSGCRSVSNIEVGQTKDLSFLTEDSLLYTQDDQIFVTDQMGEASLQISDDQKKNYSPLWQKAGEQVIYISEKNDYYQIWQHDIVAEKQELLWGSKNKPDFINISPDKLWLMYAEEKGCYLFNIEDKDARRIADACSEVNWERNEKKLLYVQDGVLYEMEFNVQQELTEPKELYNGNVSGAAYIDEKTVVFQTQNPDSDPATYDLYKLSLEDQNLEALTDLNFSNNEAAFVEVAADASKLIYQRKNPEATLPSVWLVNIGNTVLTKLILNNVTEITWSKDSENIYYTATELVENEDTVNKIYYATKDGLNKEEIVSGANQPILNQSLKSQKQL